jgi:hypothetical protein
MITGYEDIEEKESQHSKQDREEEKEGKVEDKQIRMRISGPPPSMHIH